ncbi:hypothetical protein HRbin21_00590 [bacterium HR21]|jgi:hypothetical protein|nr:hypothetical protein HRbin21_00590 [bacterium HR21]
MRRFFHLLRFEHRREALAPPRRFLQRLALLWFLVACATGVVLGIGVCGYHWLAGLSWVDALLEAALLLGGMGPLHPLSSVPGKLFAAAYALFCGLFFIAAVGVMLSPIVHRVMHRLHVEQSVSDTEP